MSGGLSSEHDDSPTVAFVFSPGDAEVVEALRVGLMRVGVRFVVDPELARAVIALISPQSVADPLWHEEVDRNRTKRFVPVRVSPVVDELVPDLLRELNWTLWRPGEPELVVGQLFLGLHTDLGRYREAKSLAAQTEAWIAAGRSEDYLLEDRSKIRVFAAELTAGGNVGAAEIGNSAREFLLASAHRVRRLRNRRARSFGWRITMSAAAIAAIVGSVNTITAVRQQIAASISVAAPVQVGTASDSIAIKTSALLLASRTAKKAFPAVDLRVLAKAFGQRWDRTVIGATAGTAVNDTVLVGSTVYGVDARGRFDEWRTVRGLPFTTWQVADAPLDFVDASAAVAVAADTRTVRVLDLRRHSVRAIDAPTSVRGIALAPTHHVVLVSGSDGTVWRIPLDGRHPSRIAAAAAVLELVQRKDGSARVLLRQDDRALREIDDSGAVVHTWSVPRAEDETGSASADGEYSALVHDGSIWTSDDGGPFVNSGRPALRVRAFGVLGGGLVASQTDAAGTAVFDPAHGVVLGGFCRAAAAVRAFSFNASGEMLCQSNGFAALDAVAEAVPKDAPPGGPSRSATSRGTVAAISIDPAGLVAITRRHVVTGAKTGLFDPNARSLRPGGDQHVVDAPGFLSDSSSATTVAIESGGDTAAVGFEDGTVWEVDVDGSGRVEPDVVWTAPDHTAVTAVTWDRDRSRLRVTTSSGLQWNAPSCAGCFNDGAVFSRIAARLPLCYPSAAIDTYGSAIRERLRLVQCAAPTGS